ncbi:MAG: hypothetical protein ACPGJV_12035 [Bacteriovoracaceae bacterium]
MVLNNRKIIIFPLLAFAFLTLRNDQKKQAPKVNESIEKIKVKERTKTKTSAVEIKEMVKVEKEQILEKQIEALFPKLERLKFKVLKTEQEKEFLANSYKSEANIQKAYRVLKRYDFSDEVLEEQRRVEAVNFLATALKQKNNHNRELILSNIKYFLLDNRFQSLDNDIQKKSVIGDKIDLLIVSFEYAPELIEEIEAHYATERMKKLLKYAKNRYEYDRSQNETI